MKKITFKNSGKEAEIGKILCVGRNYLKHAEELGNEVPEFPLIFMKPASVIIESGEKIVHPEYSNEMHHEIELVLYIGEKIKNAEPEAARKAIHGYGVGLDMTLRDVQSGLKKKGHPWTLAKVFDGSGVLSEFVTPEEYELTGKEKISLSVDGEMRQNSTLNKMIFSSVEIIKYLSTKMTLEPGDLIFTGTPEGVSKVIKGNKLYGEIENIGSLETEII
jgi:5-carboxymethyl-2-hydroxymuconate isomerase